MHTMPAALGMLLALGTPGLAFAQGSVDDFMLGGSASKLDEQCIRLTPDTPYLTGSAWFQKPVDLSQPFEMKLDLVLGKKDLEGADGIVFVFHPQTRTGFRGEGMGFAGLVPSLGIEFDTYQNLHLGDPAKDHLALMTHGDSFHVPDSDRLFELTNLEDGTRHPLRISWDPAAKQLQIWLDGIQRASYTGDLVGSVFGGNPVVYWGMTAATGRLSNAQDVCIETLFLGV